jgi:hypothetical protein
LNVAVSTQQSGGVNSGRFRFLTRVLELGHETSAPYTARSGSGGSSSVLLGVSEHGLDGRAADPRIRNRREVDTSLVHVGVACCH